MKDAVLFFGGGSDERMVSVASAQNLVKHFAFEALWFFSPSGQMSEVEKDELLSHAQPFKVQFVAKAKPFTDQLKSATERLKGKTVFLGFHGAEGENGEIQRVLEQAGISFTGSGSKSSHLCFDKAAAKKALEKTAVKLAPQLLMTGKADFLKELTGFYKEHGKIVVKPVANGSSIGLHIITNDQIFQSAAEHIQKSQDVFLAEKFMEGRELTVGVMDENGAHSALPPSEVVLNAGHSFDYEGKYLGRGTTEITPAKITDDEKKQAQQLAILAHKTLGCYGYSRTDMILTPQGEMVYIETNTLPGLTKASFIPQQLDVLRIAMKDFITLQLQLAEKRK